jgi:hypothetical protein
MFIIQLTIMGYLKYFMLNCSLKQMKEFDVLFGYLLMIMIVMGFFSLNARLEIIKFDNFLNKSIFLY